MYYIGVMSGTSLDGIDVAITEFSSNGSFQLIAANTYSFPDELHRKIKRLIIEAHSSLHELGCIDIALGQLIGNSINHLLIEHNILNSDVMAIGSHGQTIFHYPINDTPFSHQIGNANVIAELTGITTVADFRQRDIAAGGQGAPLVPAFHKALFSSDTEDRVIINIGGISNISYLPASAEQPVLGFDTGPGNTLLDHWVNVQLGRTFDAYGKWAATGKISEQLLSTLLNETYFTKSIPKSTGRELFNPSWLDSMLSEFSANLAPEDVQATLVELTAQSIAKHIHKYTPNSKTIFICGGGAHNTYLLSRLQEVLEPKRITTTEDLGLHPDWVEASAFAWLAYRTINKKPGNLPSVTGAEHAVVLGAIYPA